MNNMLTVSLLALLPLAIGTQPSSQSSITAALCGGGTVEIPIKRNQQPEPPCVAKGCHAGSCRKKFDLAQ